MYRILWFQWSHCKHWPAQYLPSKEDPLCLWNLPKRGLGWLGPLALVKIEKRICEEIEDGRRERYCDPVVWLRASISSTGVEIAVESLDWYSGRQEYFTIQGKQQYFPYYDNRAIKQVCDAERREIALERIARCETEEDLAAEYAQQEADIWEEYKRI